MNALKQASLCTGFALMLLHQVQESRLVSKLPITLKLGTIVQYTDCHGYLHKFVHFSVRCLSE